MTAIDALKQKLLSLAIQGKLVPQDPNDEPASVLLEKIKAEKAELIKQGKIKKDKQESRIYKGADNRYYEQIGTETKDITNEIPFDIPNSWEWVRLNNIGVYKKGPFGSALTKSIFVKKSNDTVKVYEQKNAIYKNEKLGDYYITKEYFDVHMKGFEVNSGDIIVSCAGTIGETFILPDKIEKGIINQALMRIRLFNSVYKLYFLIYFDYIIKKAAQQSSKGSAIKNIPPFDIFKQMLFPIPPIQEQERIVIKLNTLMKFIEHL